MNRIFIPAKRPEDWKKLLADPAKQWKRGHSARTLAHCWHDAGGIPREILSVLGRVPDLAGLEPLIIIPEHKVALPGGGAASQNDIWVLGETDTGLVSITVEGKVSEPFGPTIGEWFKDPSTGRKKRLRFLCGELGMAFPPPLHIRYQLLHRAVSAVIEAHRFRTSRAAMVVHSFSPGDEWFEDFREFARLLGAGTGTDEAVPVQLPNGTQLYCMWVHGHEKYLDC